MTIGSTNRTKPSKAARQAAKRIRNTKAELLDTITAQHKTIIEQTRVVALLSDAGERTTKNYVDSLNTQREIYELAGVRLKMVILIRRQLEKRLREAIGELLAFFEGPRDSGYVHAETSRIVEIRELAIKERG